MKPIMCGDEVNIYVPEVECSDCEEVQRNLDEFKAETEENLAGKQDTLTAGENITIENGVISATDTTYTAGTNITIVDGVISATGGGGSVTEQEILNALGFSKFNIAMTDENNVTHTWEVIGREII